MFSVTGMLVVAQHRLEDVLVHAERRGEHAGADVGHAGELEQALHRPVLAERPVEHGEDDVDVAERRATSRAGQPLEVGAGHRVEHAFPGRCRAASGPPRSICDRHDVVAVRLERGDHARAPTRPRSGSRSTGRPGSRRCGGSRRRRRRGRRAVAARRGAGQLPDVDRHDLARLRVGARRAGSGRDARSRPGSGR